MTDQEIERLRNQHDHFIDRIERRSTGRGQHFLAAPSGASAGLPDQNFTAGIADSGGIALLDSQGIVIDSVGMCADTAYLEEDPLPPLASSSLDQSYERRPGGALGSCTDQQPG